jgi:Mg2+ and Co2+ transporter CorA
MEDYRKQQEEALSALIEYNNKLVPALEEVIVELKGEPKEDTKEYLDYVLKGVNWVIQIVNATKDLLNSNHEVVVKEEMNEIILKLNRSNKENKELEVAESIENGILPFIKKVTKEAEAIVEV